jgi:hypothetical protein
MAKRQTDAGDRGSAQQRRRGAGCVNHQTVDDRAVEWSRKKQKNTWGIYSTFALEICVCFMSARRTLVACFFERRTLNGSESTDAAARGRRLIIIWQTPCNYTDACRVDRVDLPMLTQNRKSALYPPPRARAWLRCFPAAPPSSATTTSSSTGAAAASSSRIYITTQPDQRHAKGRGGGGAAAHQDAAPVQGGGFDCLFS